MQRTPVSSSNIKSVGYDPEQQVLEVEFPRGAVYRYYKVDADIHARMIAAESVGGFFAREIKGVFAFEKIEEAKQEEVA